MNFSIAIETDIFNKHIADFKKKSNLTTEVILKKFAFDLIAKIIRKTPVDMGRARGGWIPGLEGLRAGMSKTIEINVQSGSKNFSQEAFIDGQKKGSFVNNLNTPWPQAKWVEIINGVEYLIFLEYGHSQQAPFGMIRLSMREIRKGQLPKDMIEEMKKNWNSFH